jgi:putative flippase GtrA
MFNFIRRQTMIYKKFIKFTIVGMLGALVDFGSLILFVELFLWGVILSTTLAFILSSLHNFALNKFWTFRNTEDCFFEQLYKYGLVTLVGLAITIITMYVMIHFEFYYIFAKIVAIILVGFWSFYANKYWTFKLKRKNFIRK